ncbi:glucooligosaccharide oxidase [Amanita rubescens]|nr:glucooligosaccharide oxidase [Amanita rubescens]
MKFFLVLALLASYASAGNFKGDLNAVGAHAIFLGDSAYSGASEAFNERYTFQPAAITYPSTTQQVSRIVKVGVTHNHRVVARSGGHSYIANGLGGKNGVLVIDMKNMTSITVSSSGIATIQTGNRLGDIALALNAHGRGLPHGLCPYVGIGGHASFGGWGFTSRMWGLTLDTIHSLDTVLANGTIATLSDLSHPDLFWAMRGAGPSFGITTSITVKTFPEPPITTIYQYNWNINFSAVAKAISSFQKFAQTNIPKEYTAELALFKGAAVGQLRFTVTGGWYGPTDKLNATIAPYLATVPNPDSIVFKTGPYIDSLRYLGGLGHLSTHNTPDSRNTFYAKSLMTPEASPISDAALAAFTGYLANAGYSTNLNWFVQMELYGGKNSAINAVAQNATSFGRRNAMWTLQLYASSPTYNPPFPGYGFLFLDEMVNSITNNSPTGWDIGAYPNYADDRLNNWQQFYFGNHYQRLQSLKRKFDPKNTFSFPQSIEL